MLSQKHSAVIIFAFAIAIIIIRNVKLANNRITYLIRQAPAALRQEARAMAGTARELSVAVKYSIGSADDTSRTFIPREKKTATVKVEALHNVHGHYALPQFLN